MTKQILATLIVIILFAASCKENKKYAQNQNATNNKIESEQSYLYQKNGDTVLLVLQNSENKISGKLDFLPYEKDSRRGTIINGFFKGDTLFALYNSVQEGQKSECEIAFLKNGDRYILSNDIFGVNNYQYNSDYTIGNFKNKHNIKFDGDTLKRIKTKK